MKSWRLCKHEEDGSRTEFYEVLDGQNAIAEILSDGFEWEEYEANARLIAAAPDLLAALKMLLTEYQNMVHENRQDTFILEAVFNAVDKTEGK